MTMTRRDFQRLLLASAAAGLAPAAVARASKEIAIGASTFCFRDRSRNEAIAAMQELGIRDVELFNVHAYLAGDKVPHKNWIRILQEDRAQMTRWRLSVEQSHFDGIRRQFQDAGMNLFLYYSGIYDTATDEEVDREFQFAKWLGVPALSTQCEPPSVARLARFAKKHDLKVALHNTTSLFKRVRQLPSSPAEMEAQLKVSPNVYLNLDLGHFHAAGGDAMAFVKKNHRRIFNIQMKDRDNKEGPVVPCGEGSVPMADVVKLIRDKGWPITITIEYEHDAADIMKEMRRCLSEMRDGVTA
jgi:sugar phosphate isomerase/epimerase